MKRMHGSIRRQPSCRLSFAGLRRFPRRQLSVDVLIQDEDGWEIPMESLDFSPSGMFVRSSFLFEVGTVHNLIFRCPQGRELYALRAQVVRVEGQPQAVGATQAKEFVPGMAYEFIDLVPGQEERLFGLAAQV